MTRSYDHVMQINLGIRRSQLKRLEKLAAKEGRNRNELVREIVDEGLSKREANA